MSASRRGLSLLELIFAVTLASLLLTLFFQVLIPVAKGTVSTSDRAELEALAGVTLDKLRHDFHSSAAAGVSSLELSAGPIRRSLAVHPLVTLGTDSRQVWDNQLVVWWWNTEEGRLWRGTAGTVPTDRPYRVPTTEFPTLTVPTSFTRPVAINVLDFQLDGLEAGTVNSVVHVKLRLQRSSTSAKRLMTVEMESDVDFLNSAGASANIKP